ncbi:DUF5107 domain-containing protein [Martelella alba]|uniref:DUF5107 domain-containing protein n=1 Tax=Martelella alba TaxID=2590451 RepID=A0ABY2SKR7_9HYPH|nr:DUF5107 domain-containing protein [Martelella alba]TKI06160.1 DUF5107 domain-containing protein [Martelella alba]
MAGAVKIWREDVTIPTYPTGEQDTHPMFLEHRVYQGSSGAVYPYGVIDTLVGERAPRQYQALWLENDYLRIMFLPELGGRIQRAYDKIRGRDFIYHNEVIKPALVGLLGPWISGGIEFNWPQHHRPTTFMPVDYQCRRHDDGSCTVWLGEAEPMRGLQVMAGFTLYPDRALLEISARIFNGNDTPRHFLWWANPAVKGGDGHQSVFPPDVTAVFDHGKRDVSTFPIATGTYYKVDYSAGVDISRYKNIPVPTSYMAYKSDYDFVGAYDHEERGGLLHVADHDVSPGKKQWTWGNCEFGRAWDRNLTDANGPYIELMTGVFTDNQPDFTWLDAGEEKRFTQNFLPYHSLGTIQNANTLAALKLERTGAGLTWGLYAIAPLSGYRLVIRSDAMPRALLDIAVTLSPVEVLLDELTGDFPGRLTMELLDGQGKTALAYLEHRPTGEPLPTPAVAPRPAGEIDSADEAWFIGQHLEQYNHAGHGAQAYYQRGVALDPGDYRCNLALAVIEYNRADYPHAISYADAALRRAHRLNKNPQYGDASLLRARAEERLGQLQPAYEDFYRATWSGDGKAGGFFGLARIAARRRQWTQALSFVEQGLACNKNHYAMLALKVVSLQRTGRLKESLDAIDGLLETYPLHYLLYALRHLFDNRPESLAALHQVTGDRGINALNIAADLLSFGMDAEALAVLQWLDSQETLPLYLRARLLKPQISHEAYLALLKQARDHFAGNVRFPNQLAEVACLEQIPECGFAHYLLGCFHYSKRNYTRAVEYWRQSLELEPGNAGAWRDLGVFYFNKEHNPAEAEHCLRKALALAPEDARLLFELDCLRRLCGVEPASRLELLTARLPVALKRDDIIAELLSLYNQLGQWHKAKALLLNHDFHPWEGGEGRVTGQYIIASLRQAHHLLTGGQPGEAARCLREALHYPANLGEGRLVGQTDNDIYFWLGVCAAQTGDGGQAETYFLRAAQGCGDLVESRYYNDQPVDYLFYRGAALARLGKRQQAAEIFDAMGDWAAKAIEQPAEPDFFAVSLPDLVVLDSDPQESHRQHCLFVGALASLGQGDATGWRRQCAALLTRYPSHDKAQLFSTLAERLAVEMQDGSQTHF